MNIIDIEAIKNWLISSGINNNVVVFLNSLIILIIIAFLSFIADWITKKIILSILKRIIKKSKNTWDDIFLEKRVFNRLSHIAPALVVNVLIGVAFADFPIFFVSVIQTGTYIYMLIIGVIVANSTINALHEIYNTLPVSKSRSINGYVQTVKFIIYLIGSVIILSVILRISPFTFLAGLSAMAAVLMFIFKDVLLGFVSSIQVAANDIVKPGDWIVIPKHNIDGNVMEINLTTVKVRNWDNSISTVPTYSLTSDSFQNMKGLDISEGRRIKRSINIDIRTIHYVSSEFVERINSNSRLHSFIEKLHCHELITDDRPTNLGIFREYVEWYLMSHPKINKNMTLLVRSLPLTETGVPLEIYCFTYEKDVVNYEKIQFQLTEHIIAMLPEFELKAFQKTTDF